MGGVVDAISDAVGSVVDAVGDAVEWAADTVSNVVEHALDNPVETALMVGLTVATGGAGAAALGLEAPLTAMEASLGAGAVSGASTLAKGGDLGDALTSAATTFAVAQGVSYAFDSFNAAGTPDSGATTTQFSDTGQVTQNFADGSKVISAPDGAVTPVPAPDLQGQVFDPATLSWKPASEVNTDWSAAGVQPSGAETFPVTGPGTVQTTDLPGLDVGVASSTPTAGTTYETMEDLLKDKGITYPAPVPPIDDAASRLPESFGNATAIDPNAKTYNTMEDLLHDKGAITDAEYRDITGVAPVVDKSVPAGPMSDTTLTGGLKDLGGAVIDTIKENPWTSAAVIGGGLAATGALGGDQTPPAATSDPTQKTYTYGPGAPINRTGLDQLWSAASKIYGGDEGVMKQLGIQPVQAPQFQSSFQPLLSGAAPGGGNVGLGALGQGFSYTPMGRAQTFDISTLSPEQIVQLQEAVNRKKPGEGV
jgi:hypothetical protein